MYPYRQALDATRVIRKSILKKWSATDLVGCYEKG